MGCFNLKTGSIEKLETIPDDRWDEFIPQDKYAQMLYRFYVDHKGMTPEEAAIAVLEAATGFGKYE